MNDKKNNKFTPRQKKYILFLFIITFVIASILFILIGQCADRLLPDISGNGAGFREGNRIIQETREDIQQLEDRSNDIDRGFTKSQQEIAEYTREIDSIAQRRSERIKKYYKKTKNK